MYNCDTFELWESIINGLFIPTQCVNGEVVDKLNSLWTKKKTESSKLTFKIKTYWLCL